MRLRPGSQALSSLGQAGWLVLGGVLAVLLLRAFSATLSAPLDADESLVWRGLQKLAQTGSLYGPPDHAVYTPLYYWISLPLVGLGPVGPRLLTTLCFGFVLAAWMALLRAWRNPALAGVLLAAACLHPDFLQWAHVLRVDMLGLALALWGLVLARRQSPWAFALLLLAFFTKQTLVAAALAAHWRQPRRLALFALSCGLGLALGAWLSQGWMARDLWGMATEWSFAPMVFYLYLWPQEHPQLAMALLVALALPLLSRRWDALAVYTLAGLGIALFGFAHRSGTNFLLEPTVAATFWLWTMATGSAPLEPEPKPS